MLQSFTVVNEETSADCSGMLWHCPETLFSYALLRLEQSSMGIGLGLDAHLLGKVDHPSSMNFRTRTPASWDQACLQHRTTEA